MSSSLLVRDIMSAEVLTVSPETTVREAAEILASKGIGGLPVVTGERIVGMVSVRDIIDFSAETPGVPTAREEGDAWPEEVPPPDDSDEASEPSAVYFLELWLESGADLVDRFAHDHGAEWDVLDEHVVGELMTTDLVTVAADAAVTAAAGLMVRSGVHRLLVVEGQRLVGLVTATDLLRAFSVESRASA